MIIQIFRSISLERFSIENVFNVLEPYIGRELDLKKRYVPCSGVSLGSIFTNFSFLNNEKGIYHITGDVHYLSLLKPRQTILTIHDIHSLKSDKYFKSVFIYFFWLVLPCIFVKRITVISEFTRSELLKILPCLNYKLSVIPNPVDEQFVYHPKNIFPRIPNILFIGTKANKNLERFIMAIGGVTCNLIIIGNLSDSQRHLLLQHNISFKALKNLSKKEILNEYINCDLLCFPSIYEGFGLPIVEAQAVGRPVITSNFGAMKEIAGDGACLVNPFDPLSIRAGILKILKSIEYREELIRLGLTNSKRFKASIVAQRYLEIYKEFV